MLPAGAPVWILMHLRAIPRDAVRASSWGPALRPRVVGSREGEAIPPLSQNLAPGIQTLGGHNSHFALGAGHGLPAVRPVPRAATGRAVLRVPGAPARP